MSEISVSVDEFRQAFQWIMKPDNKERVRKKSKAALDGALKYFPELSHLNWTSTLLIGSYADPEDAVFNEMLVSDPDSQQFKYLRLTNELATHFDSIEQRISQINTVLKHASNALKIKRRHYMHFQRVTNEITLWSLIWKKVSKDAEGKDDSKVLYFSHAQEAYKHLEAEYVSKDQLRNTVLLQYSLEACKSLLTELASLNRNPDGSKKVKIEAYHQGPWVANHLGMSYQVVSILTRQQARPVTLQSLYPQIDFFEYEVPAAMSGVLIDGTVLLLSWYTYKLTNKYAESLAKNKEDKTSIIHPVNDPITLIGHLMPALIIQEGHRDFKRMAADFLAHVGQVSGEGTGEIEYLKSKPYDSTGSLLTAATISTGNQHRSASKGVPG
jgi:hypothetical protein